MDIIFSKVLSYWRNIEFFIPFDLERVLENNAKKIAVTSKQDYELPWIDPESYDLKLENEYAYDFYFGLFDQSQVNYLLKERFPDIEKEFIPDISKIDGIGCFARITLNQKGHPLFQELSVSSYPWATEALIKKEELTLSAFQYFISSKLEALKIIEDLKDERDDLMNHDGIVNLSSAFSNSSILKFNPDGLIGFLVPYSLGKKKEKAKEQEQLRVNKIKYSRLALSKIVRKKRKVDILNSFYMQDLEKAHIALKSSSENKLKALTRYLGCIKHKKKRIDLLSNFETDFIKSKTVKKYSLKGRWPAPVNQNASLNQALAINIFQENNDSLISVNGPPGTGKTVLVRDIIADNIVQRAKVLATLKKPEDAFNEKKDDYQIGNHSFKLRSLISNLKGFEVLLASNNNAAVENISKELPKKSSLGEEFLDTNYLTSLASLYSALANDDKDFTSQNQDTWGLPSVALGKKRNRELFREAAFTRHYQESVEQTKERVNSGLNLTLYDLRARAPKKGRSFNASKKHFKDLLKSAEKMVDELEEESGSLNIDERSIQLTAPNSNPKLNSARSALFISALELHEAWVREVPRLEKEFRALEKLLRSPMSLSPEAAKEFWALLFLIVPVISTTLASVERMFGTLQEEVIGTLVIDEAGQATPQSCVGAIMRAKKVLVLGDQKQLEPIVSVPRSIDDYFLSGLDKELREIYSPLKSSTQSLADLQSDYGTYFNKSLWVGIPLLVHRRCMEPMFSISNEIAYDNLMISATGKRNSYFSLGPSSWLQITGETKGKHWIPDYANLISELLYYLLKRDLREAVPDFFLISPFKEIRLRIREVLNKVMQEINFPLAERGKIRKRVGTVHSFQGKEASIVVFVLGCDRSSELSAEWAGSKANLLNVAVTRAKDFIYVIGDVNLWHNKGYFSDLQKSLPEVDAGEFLHDLQNSLPYTKF